MAILCPPKPVINKFVTALRRCGHCRVTCSGTLSIHIAFHFEPSMMASRTTTDTSTTSSSGTVLDITREGNITGFSDELLYETVTLQDCQFSAEENVFYYLCPCGDLFEFQVEELLKGNLLAECPSCSLRARMVLKKGELEEYLARQ